MDTDKLGSWLGLLANFGVLVGIFFLVLEMQQNRELMQVQIQQSRSDSSVNLALAFADSAEAIPFLTQSMRGEELTGAQVAKLSFYLRATHSQQQNVYIQIQNEMLPFDNLETIREHTNFFIVQTSVGRDFWERWKHTFDQGYVQYVDNHLKELESRE